MGIEVGKRKLSNKKYRFNFTHQHHRYTSPWFDTKLEAEEWAAQKRLDIKYKQEFSGADIQVERFCKLWLEKHAFVNKVRTAAVKDEQYLRIYVIPKLGRLRLRRVSASQWEFLIAELRAEGRLSPKTINNLLGTIKRMLSDAVRWKYLNQNPIAYLKPAKLNTQIVKHLYPAEVRQLLDYTRDNHPLEHSLFVFALNTGCRLGECLALSWDKVDFDNRVATIDSTFDYLANKVVQRTKGKRFRKVPLNLATSKVLRSDYLGSIRVWEEINYGNFTNRKCRSILLGAGLAAAIERGASFHSMRHTFASQFMRQGGDIYKLQQLLGHSTVQQTEKYSHFSPDRVRGLTDSISY